MVAKPGDWWIKINVTSKEKELKMEIKSEDFSRLSNLACLGLKARKEKLSGEQKRLGRLKELRATKRRLRLLEKQILWEQLEIAEDESLLKELVKESVKT